MMNKFRIKLFDRKSVLCIIFFNASLSWIISVISVIHTIINTVEYLKEIKLKISSSPKSAPQPNILHFNFITTHSPQTVHLYNITNQLKWLDTLKRVWNGRFNYFYTDYTFSVEKLVGGISLFSFVCGIDSGIDDVELEPSRGLFFLIIAFD